MVVVSIIVVVAIAAFFVLRGGKTSEGLSVGQKIQGVVQSAQDAEERARQQLEEAKRKKEEERLARIQEIVDSVADEYEKHKSYLMEALLSPTHYFAFSEMEQFVEDVKPLLFSIGQLKDLDGLDSLGPDVRSFTQTIKDIKKVRERHNKDFVVKELEENREFFDTALDYPLDKQQRESIVKLEDNCLVVSSAGSGKTSTMIGKLLYLVTKRAIPPGRIMTISYTHKAADELTQRLLGTGLSCMTFHKLAMSIVAQVEGKMPSIADNQLFLSVFYDQLKKPEFRTAILNYLTDYKSLVKNEHDYASSVEYYRDRKKYGVIALYTDKDDRLISTKSEEEKKICCYLTEMGVAFKYEEPYEFETMTEEFRQYRPDFSIYYPDKNGVERRIYLEHFAIDSAGNVPKWFGNGFADGWLAANNRYKEGIIWKKDLHRQHHTTLLCTSSADFHNNKIRTKLRTLLSDAGVPLKEPTKEELIERILSRNKSLENALLQMTQAFVNLVKANGRNIDEIRAAAEKKKAVRDVFVIDHIMKPLWDDYQAALEAKGEMDFTDVIVKATNYCNEGKWKHKYEYILVDEFQDISVDRYKFLCSLRTDLPKTKLYCVGDDWQSIYRFSGSDMSLFSEFSKYFGYTEECKIETTYRFGNPLIEESSRFVVANPTQKKKSVHPRAVNPPETKISFMGYKDNQELQSLIYRMIERVPEDKTAYIISRYSYDVKVLSSPFIKMDYDANGDKVILTIANRKVTFMTIHGSKGLEADYVFLLNCNNGLYGFPSLVSDDPVLDYVLCDPEHYEYAEERRVFYVGITRAKVHTVVMYQVDTPSPFVSEMDKKVIINPNPCPWCGVGRRILKYEGWTKNKTPYKVWGCDNKEANCQYFEREFANGDFMVLNKKPYRGGSVNRRR